MIGRGTDVGPRPYSARRCDCLKVVRDTGCVFRSVAECLRWGNGQSERDTTPCLNRDIQGHVLEKGRGIGERDGL